MKTRPGTGALAVAVIAGSAAVGAGVTAALAARHGGHHHHHRHVHVSVRCVEASHGGEADAAVVAVDLAGTVVVSGASSTDKRRKVRKRRRCRRDAGEGARFVVMETHASGADHVLRRGDRSGHPTRPGHATRSDHAAEADALRLRLNDARIRWRLDQADGSSGDAMERMKKAAERMEHAMERLEAQVTAAQQEAERLASGSSALKLPPGAGN